MRRHLGHQLAGRARRSVGPSFARQGALPQTRSRRSPRHLGALPAATNAAADDVDLDALAERHELTGGLIKNAVLMAMAAAVHEADDLDAAQITMGHLDGAARDQLIRPRTDNDALVQPEVRLRDVVLQASLLEKIEEVVAAARNGRTVLDSWGGGRHLNRDKGIVALLSGPPGTGKTLTAEAIASELGRPLLAVGSSSVLSKWVGETKRQLEKLFETSRERGAVLFIDKCDSVVGTRSSESNGAWSVSMVTTVLRLIERHEGVVLLATNRPEALDPALTRRLSHHLRFQLPSAAIQNTAFRAVFRAAHAGRGLQQRDLELAAAEEEPVDGGAGFSALVSSGIEA